MLLGPDRRGRGRAGDAAARRDGRLLRAGRPAHRPRPRRRCGAGVPTSPAIMPRPPWPCRRHSRSPMRRPTSRSPGRTGSSDESRRLTGRRLDALNGRHAARARRPRGRRRRFACRGREGVQRRRRCVGPVPRAARPDLSLGGGRGARSGRRSGARDRRPSRCPRRGRPHRLRAACRAHPAVPAPPRRACPVEARDQPGAGFGLTARERELVALVERGLTNVEIARRLGLGRPTVARILGVGDGEARRRAPARSWPRSPEPSHRRHRGVRALRRRATGPPRSSP